MLVMKFGGTSVKDPAAITRLAGIVRNAGAGGPGPVVVVSALSKVTDQLVAITEPALAGETPAIAAVIDKPARVRRDCGDGQGRQAPGRARHRARSRSQRADLADPCARRRPRRLAAPAGRDRRDRRAALQPHRRRRARRRGPGRAGWMRAACWSPDNSTARRAADGRNTARCRELRRCRSSPRDAFRCSAASSAPPAGATTTLGRGGSDYSAAIVGVCLAVDEIQIWTDVDGMLTADPRVDRRIRSPVPSCRSTKRRELAYFGAKVLHPAHDHARGRPRNIPVRILNSRRPEVPGR